MKYWMSSGHNLVYNEYQSIFTITIHKEMFIEIDNIDTMQKHMHYYSD